MGEQLTTFLDRKVVVKIQQNWILYVYLSTRSQNEYMRDVCLSLKSTKRRLAISQGLFNLLQLSVLIYFLNQAQCTLSF